MKKMINRWLTMILLLIVSGPLLAGDMLMVRSKLPFPLALKAVQATIEARGYTVAGVENVDLGLLRMGYLSDSYKVLSFGKAKEIEALIRLYPELAPYLPLQILVFSERDDTLLVATSPAYLATLFPHTGIAAIFARWEGDLQVVLELVRDAEHHTPVEQDGSNY
ncbi:MAG: DUF302 domain-containing protein [Gallionellaceae bacterium]|jgi:uncharacterized protein (DUF302 family)|nr:DUF302 domain-containing protein [Gallionellaceae bacterium]